MLNSFNLNKINYYYSTLIIIITVTREIDTDRVIVRILITLIVSTSTWGSVTTNTTANCK